MFSFVLSWLKLIVSLGCGRNYLCLWAVAETICVSGTVAGTQLGNGVHVACLVKLFEYLNGDLSMETHCRKGVLLLS